MMPAASNAVDAAPASQAAAVARKGGGAPAAARGESPPAATAVPEARPLESALEIETELGGLFYLVNLALFLGLYSDFTMATPPVLALPIWDFVALVGRRLVPRLRRRDPLWRLLGELSGRGEAEPVGAGFEPPRWRPPPGWERRRRGRRHPKPSDPLERWLDWLMPNLRHRLRRALGPTPGVPLGRFVCAHRARVVVSATRLEVHFSLAELPLAIRLAGLDRDPGWVPAAGRSIAFRFA
jgi:hypothetical protein